MRLKFASLFIVVPLALLVGWQIVKPWLAHEGLSNPPSSEELLKAVSIDPRNPSYHYRLGLYNHYDPTERDLGRALEYYIAATGLDPTKAEHWLELAKVYEGLDDMEASVKALDRALELAPTDLKIRWVMVNLELRRAETERAMGELKLVLRDHPRERVKAFSLLHSIAGGDVGVVIKKAIPEDPETMMEYLAFLMGRGDTEGVKGLWKTIAEGFEIDPMTRMRYVDYMISRNEMADARAEWARHKGVSSESADIVWNGGFEADLDNWGFGWRIGRVEGADITLDYTVSFRGRRSLKIEFDGGNNLDFHHARQIIPLEPLTNYTLRAYIMTDEITTTNGIFIQINGINGCKFSTRTEALTGTNEWRELRVEVKTPPGCNAGELRVRRAKSDRLDNLLNGTVWIDEVRLVRSHGGAS